jgi:iron complex outermembrane receptor protein
VGFDNDLLQVISETSDPTTGATLIGNRNGDHGHGVELEMIANRTDGWSGRASYSFLKTDQKGTGQKVPNSPSYLGKLNATVPASSHGLLGVELFYTGSQPNYLGQRISSSFLTNITASSRFRRSSWSISASCYDLFNRQWSTPTGPEVLPAATVQDGRTWRITIAYKKHLEPARSGP